MYKGREGKPSAILAPEAAWTSKRERKSTYNLILARSSNFVNGSSAVRTYGIFRIIMVNKAAWGFPTLSLPRTKTESISLLLPDFNQNWNVSTILLKFPNSKLQDIHRNIQDLPNTKLRTRRRCSNGILNTRVVWHVHHVIKQHRLKQLHFVILSPIKFHDPT